MERITEGGIARVGVAPLPVDGGVVFFPVKEITGDACVFLEDFGVGRALAILRPPGEGQQSKDTRYVHYTSRPTLRRPLAFGQLQSACDDGGSVGNPLRSPPIACLLSMVSSGPMVRMTWAGPSPGPQ